MNDIVYHAKYVQYEIFFDYTVQISNEGLTLKSKTQ